MNNKVVKMLLKYLVIFYSVSVSVDAARILFVYSTPSQSHVLSLQALSVVIAEKGHDVTFMSAFPLNKKIENYREVKIQYDEKEKLALQQGMIKDSKNHGFLSTFPKFIKMIFDLGNDTLQSEELKNLKKEKFDLVVVGYFMNDFMLGLGDHFKCPTILFSPGGILGTLYEAIGNPMGVNGFPHVMHNGKNMDFVGRLKTFMFSGIETLMAQYFKYRSRQLYE
jgi:glucuronosyltransferase